MHIISISKHAPNMIDYITYHLFLSPKLFWLQFQVKMKENTYYIPNGNKVIRFWNPPNSKWMDLVSVVSLLLMNTPSFDTASVLTKRLESQSLTSDLGRKSAWPATSTVDLLFQQIWTLIQDSWQMIQAIIKSVFIVPGPPALSHSL